MSFYLRTALAAVLAWAALGGGGYLVQAAPRPTTVSPAGDPFDWPMWRGPEQNGISRELNLPDDLDPGGDQVLWRRAELGTRSTPIVMNGKLYLLCRDQPFTDREGEKVVCVDPATGETIWENRFNVYLSDVPDTRVAWSCVVGDPETGRVYALGVCGYFVCLDGQTGETIWSRSLHEEFGLLSTYGGRTNVPVVHEDLVIISAVVIGWGDMARPAHRFLAFDKHRGDVVWFNGTNPLPEDTTYSTPVLTVLAGQRAMVFGSGDGRVWAFQPRTGVPIWNCQLSRRGLNLMPLVDGDTIYIGQSEENYDDTTMGAMAAINGALAGDVTSSAFLWRNKEQMVGKSAPLLLDGRIYAADDSGALYILDAATGKEITRRVKLAGTIMRASLLYGDGKIYGCTTSALHVLEPNDRGVRIVSRSRLPDGEEVHGSPIVSRGRLFLPTTEALYCYARQGAQPETTARPDPPREDSLGDNTRPAHLQLVPAESLVLPGQTVQHKVRLFNSRGQLLGESQASFSVEGGGQIDAQGLFTADSVPRHTAAIVTAKVGELSGTARIRIVPPLPWKFDFSDGEVPITWIGARYRHQIRPLDGNPVMVKVTTIPKGTRSQAWMGPTDFSNYTIQADIRGAISNDKMPDIGLIAQRYTLDLMGASQQLQIRTWTPQLERMSATVPFAWKPDVWYTMKFRAAVEDGKAVLRGKVWEKGQAEPAEWTVVGADHAPNTIGSPGLYGNAKDAEIFIDNISVYPNQ